MDGMQVGVVTFEGSDRAEHLVNSLRQRGAVGMIDEVGILEHHENGRFSVLGVAEGGTRGEHAAVGAVIGGAVAALMGPLGLLFGVAGGAAVGALMEGRDPHQLSLPEAFMSKLREALPPGTSAVLLIGPEESVTQLVGEIHSEGAVSKGEIRQDLTDAQVEVIRKALEAKKI